MRAPLVCFRAERGADAGTRTGEGGADGRRLACARCGQVVARPSDRTSVAGSHEHTFANPHGFLFHIGCFAAATGCAPEGPALAEWSWFPPHTWQMERCAACGEHLGWLFRDGAHRFHGLILDRLVEVEDD